MANFITKYYFLVINCFVGVKMKDCLMYQSQLLNYQNQSWTKTKGEWRTIVLDTNVNTKAVKEHIVQWEIYEPT